VRAEELAAEGDHAGAAIWRRVTAAIEQLTDTTGPPILITLRSRATAGAAHPEPCVEANYPQRTRFECIAERKLRRRQLTEDGNVEISGRDLREKSR
jgi:hypothetical protein